jgi:hypothetical protein
MVIILSIFRYIYYMTKNMTNLPRLELTETPNKKLYIYLVQL